MPPLDFGFRVDPRRRVRVILDVDAKGEADGPLAIVHALLSPGLEVKAIVAAHFVNPAFSDSMERSYLEIALLLNLMGRESDLAYRGQQGPLDEQVSEGVQKIIEEAMREDALPLYVLCLGAMTNTARAMLERPEIIPRMTVIFVGGGMYPLGGREHNLASDREAANAVFRSGVSLWQVPQNVYCRLQVSLTELKCKVAPHGKVGAYLFNRLEEHTFQDPGDSTPLRSGECCILGSSSGVGILLCEQVFSYDMLPAPQVNAGFGYVQGIGHRIRVYREVDSRFILEDLYAKLALLAASENRKPKPPFRQKASFLQRKH